jgi:hypothetical protein
MFYLVFAKLLYQDIIYNMVIMFILFLFYMSCTNKQQLYSFFIMNI